MKLMVYNNFLNFTTRLLNICVRYQMWFFAKSLINFRKQHIAFTMRKEIASVFRFGHLK